MFDITTIGGATRDITFLTDKGRIIKTPENLTEQAVFAFEYGAKIRSSDVYFNFGGGACNTAVTFANLGIRSAANCCVGNDDDGNSILRNLKKVGVDTSLVQTDAELKTGFSLVVVNRKKKVGGDRVIFAYRGANERLNIKRENINKSRWIYLTSVAGNWKSGLNEIKKAVENCLIKLAWNPGAAQIRTGKKGLESLLKKTELLILNKDEAIEFVQSDKSVKLDLDEMNNPAVLSKTIGKFGPSATVVTDGKNGAYLFTGGSVLYSKATSKDRVDTTGAGDSFGSALVGGYILTNNFETALKYGIINSGSVVNEYGAQNGILDRRRIEKKLKSVEVDYLE